MVPLQSLGPSDHHYSSATPQFNWNSIVPLFQRLAQGAKIDAPGTRLSEVEREQARLEGANSMLSNLLRQQSHTHETGD